MSAGSVSGMRVSAGTFDRKSDAQYVADNKIHPDGEPHGGAPMTWGEWADWCVATLGHLAHVFAPDVLPVAQLQPGQMFNQLHMSRKFSRVVFVFRTTV